MHATSFQKELKLSCTNTEFAIIKISRWQKAKQGAIESRKDRRKPRARLAHRSSPEGSKHLPEMGCPSCFRLTNAAVHTCQFHRCCPFLPRTPSLRIQLGESLAFGFWVSEAPGIREEGNGISGGSLQRRSVGGSKMGGIP